MTTLLKSRTETAHSITPVISAFAERLSRRVDRIRARHRMARDMAMLCSLDPHMLADIGLRGFHHLPEDAQVALLRAALRNNRLPI